LLAVPPAHVSWRGRSLGNTPLLDVPLPAGSHTLTLRSVRGERTATVRVRIRPGRLTRRSVSLE
jgi:serine/threonine-protein kinase